MTALLSLQEYAENPIRIYGTPDAPLFVAADVCRVLKIVNSRKAVSDLDDDEKGVTTGDTPGGKQEMNVVTESGLYHLIFKSRKAEAKAFRKWVTTEVLPSIRKTGAYLHTTIEDEENPAVREFFLLMEQLQERKVSSDTAAQVASELFRSMPYREGKREMASAASGSVPIGLLEKGATYSSGDVLSAIPEAGITPPVLFQQLHGEIGISRATFYRVWNNLKFHRQVEKRSCGRWFRKEAAFIN